MQGTNWVSERVDYKLFELDLEYIGVAVGSCVQDLKLGKDI